MNTLSWIIYGAEIIDRISTTLFLLSIFGGITIAIATVICLFQIDNGDAPPNSWKKPARFLWLIGAMLIVGIILPSPETTYMIAGSQVAETVVTSPDGAKIMSELKAVILKKLKEELETSK